MKSIKYLIVLVCMTFVSISLFAQEKELRTESDGFQWYKLIQHGKVGAQSIGGVTFIPLSRGYTFISYSFTHGGWFSVRKGDKENGVCDITGREIIAPGRYDAAYYRNEKGFEYVCVDLNGKHGACDMNGREILPPRYDTYIQVWEECGYKYIRVRLNNKEGIYDINGREIIAPRYESLVQMECVFKYQDSSGKWVSTGIKLSSLAQTPSTNPTPSPSPSPTPQLQPQSQQVQPQPVHQPQPMQVWKQCFFCQGSGQCQNCLGTGHTLVYPCQDRCWTCGGSGKCTHCAGHGGQNVIEYH